MFTLLLDWLGAGKYNILLHNRLPKSTKLDAVWTQTDAVTAPSKERRKSRQYVSRIM